MAVQKRNQDMVRLLSVDFVERSELLTGLRRLSLTAVAGTDVPINTVGEVGALLTGLYVLEASDGATAGGLITATAPTGTFDLYNSGGGEACTLTVNADGSADVARSAGTLTYDANLLLLWI